jgi:hypothetical protein
MALPDSLSTLVPYQALRWHLSISQTALRSGSELSEGPIMLSEGPIRLSGDRCGPHQALDGPTRLSDGPIRLSDGPITLSDARVPYQGIIIWPY